MNINENILISLAFDGDELIVPVNPKELQISQTARNENIEIIGIGQTTRKGHPDLITLTIDSFFPASNSYFKSLYIDLKYYRTPKESIELIQRMWKTENIDNKVPQLTTKGLDVDLSMPVVIEKFNYKYEAGDLDVSYSLALKEYIPYGVRVETTKFMGMATARNDSVITSTFKYVTNNVSYQQSSPATVTTTSTGVKLAKNQYTTKEGDTLWTITTQCTGDDGRVQELYDLNKNIVIATLGIDVSKGSFPAGVVLTLPEGFVIRTTVTMKINKSNDTEVKKSNIDYIKAKQVKKEETLKPTEETQKYEKRANQLNPDLIKWLNKIEQEIKKLNDELKKATTKKEKAEIKQKLNDAYMKKASYINALNDKQITKVMIDDNGNIKITGRTVRVYL